MESQYCSFALDGLTFGIPVERIQEIIRFQDVTAVPLVHPAVYGLINLRGQIVTAIDLRVRLGLPERGDDDRPMNIVISHDEEAISLLVDRIGDVVEVDDDDFESPPDTLDASSKALISGAYKLESSLLLVLDVERAITLN